MRIGVKPPASITKTKRGRHIEISANGRAWLLPYAHSIAGVFARTLRARWLADCVCSPSNIVSRQLNTAAGIGSPSDWLAMHGDIDQLCLFLGHTNPEVTFRHYAKVATAGRPKSFGRSCRRVRRASRKLLRSAGQRRRAKGPQSHQDDRGDFGRPACKAWGA